ncbi:Ankyrin repeat-containing protein [Dichanthelium oligosanthes]|uniref:Ankyrin repeat-containing protein n=1 Tax=Dichanthelium oligosanthes TaxID=888268 RepID=A0A1E5URS9_9POAL|nr:Ankyrin repeat-containing protein [Dichanthelium oligosanthes]
MLPPPQPPTRRTEAPLMALLLRAAPGPAVLHRPADPRRTASAASPHARLRADRPCCLFCACLQPSQDTSSGRRAVARPPPPSQMADQVGSKASGGSTAVVSSARSMHALASDDSRVLLGITPLGNNCLHICPAYGLKGFCKNDMELENQSLLTAVNVDGEMPLITRSRSSSSGGSAMDRRVLEAATSGDADRLALDNPGELLGTTPLGNTFLHIASIHGQVEFCKNVLTLEMSQDLLSAVNGDGETPLLTAVTRGHSSLAFVLLRSCRDKQLSEAILKQDKRGCNALHHAIRRGYEMLALELIEAEPALTKAVNIYKESPMFIAAMRNFTDVVEKLLAMPDSSHSGASGFNALHAAVRNGNSDIAKRILNRHPQLISEETENNLTPMHLAVSEEKIDVLTVLLEYDQSLGYLISTTGIPLLCTAASEGHVGVARELLKHCPDVPYCDATGSTCLHEAVLSGHAEFVEFILGSQQLRQLVNMVNRNRETALHLAVKRCNSKMVAALLLHQDIDVTVLNGNGITANLVLPDDANKFKPLISVCMFSPYVNPQKCSKTRYIIGPATTGSPGATGMDRVRLLEAARSGDGSSLKHLALRDPGILLATNPQGNTCLHIASIHGRKRFCTDAIALNPSLLAAVNTDGETPLLIAVTSGYVPLASVLLSCCREHHMNRAILKQDKNGCNALHHAIRSGHGKLALALIAAEPSLSQAVNSNNESPMFIAVRRDLEDVFEELIKISDSAHGGTRGYNVLHAAVCNGNPGIVQRIMETRPWLAREEELTQVTPVHAAVYENKVDILRLLLQHDRSLGYLIPTSGEPLLCIAAFVGHVGVARELLYHCPDAPFRTRANWTCLHTAVFYGQTEFVNFILVSQQLRKLINMRDESSGETALHFAVRKCHPKIVAALLNHPDIDITVLSKRGQTPTWVLFNAADHAKTLNWNEVYMLLLKADPKIATSTYNLHGAVKDEVNNASRKDIKALTKKYTRNASIVAILIATITFAAPFTLPGGYSSGAGNEGYPVMARNLAFQAFLVSDTLAMCSSLAVAFICIIAKWEDLEFLLYYRSLTKKFMWFAYVATTIAFATGLYTVLAPRLLWLAVTVCLLTVFLPILTKLLGEWPIWKLRIKLGWNFKSELLDMV